MILNANYVCVCVFLFLFLDAVYQWCSCVNPGCLRVPRYHSACHQPVADARTVDIGEHFRISRRIVHVCVPFKICQHSAIPP